MAESQIERNLSVFDGMSIVIGLIVGVGIYQTPPTIAASVGSMWELFGVWILGGLLTVAGAMVYAELGSMFPQSGGDYFFLRRSLGPHVAFVYGWSQLFLIRPGAIAAVSYPVANHLLQIVDLGISEPYLAAGFVVLISILNILGANFGRVFQNWLAMLSVGLIVALALLFLFVPYSSEVVPATKVVTNTNYGLALILVLFCYGGWSELTFLGSEMREPTRSIPLTLLGGVGCVALLYLLLNAGFCARLGFEGLAGSAAPAVASVPKSWHSFIAFLLVLCTLSSLNALIMAGGRLGFAYGEDVFWLEKLGTWDHNRQSPTMALLLQMILATIIAVLAGTFAAVLVYTTAVVWTFYFLVGIGFLVLRIKEPGLERPFRVVCYPFVLAVFLASCLYLIWSALDYDLNGTLYTLGFCLLGFLVFMSTRKRQLARNLSEQGE